MSKEQIETVKQNFIKAAVRVKKAGCDASKHMIAVTSETSPLAHNPDYMAAFYMDDYIGGRYSSTSGVGGAVLSLAFGPKVFQEFQPIGGFVIYIFISSKNYIH